MNAFKKLRVMADRITLTRTVRCAPPHTGSQGAGPLHLPATLERCPCVYGPGPCRDTAEEIYAKIYETKALRGRGQEGTLAATLYLACRQERVRILLALPAMCPRGGGGTNYHVGG